MNQRMRLSRPTDAECVVRCVTRYLTFHMISEAFSCMCVALLKDSHVKNGVRRNTNVCFPYFKNYEISERHVSRYFLFTAVCVCVCVCLCVCVCVVVIFCSSDYC